MTNGQIYKVGGVDYWGDPCPDQVAVFVAKPDPILAYNIGKANRGDLVTVINNQMAFRDIESVEVLHPVHGVCHIGRRYLTAA